MRKSPKYPMAFKGPINQIQQFFSEEVIYRASQLLFKGSLSKWHYKEALELVTASLKSNKKSHKTSLSWPLNKDFDEALGSCNCDNPKPCVHLAALLIETKTKLDQLPPFTGQIQASQNIAETFSLWMNKQTHDPYPNMARHRVAYILDFEDNEFSVSLHKSYISTEGRYSLKAPIDSDIINLASLPKFMTLSDQRICHLIQQYHGVKTHQFTLKEVNDVELLNEIFLTERCFWKACYRSPLTYQQNVNILNRNAKPIIAPYYLNTHENSIETVDQSQNSAVKIDLSQYDLTPHLHISTEEHQVEANQKHFFEIDFANISFIYNNIEFTFADLSNGKIIPELSLLEQMASYLRQIENLNSVYAHFERTVIKDFHLNDRFLSNDYGSYVTLIRGLELDGWKITINQNFRLNQSKINDWYAKINKTKTNIKTNQNWFDFELGITIDGQMVNILPYLVKAIGQGKISNSTTNYTQIKLDNGNNVSLNNNSLKQIISTLSELYDENSLNNDNQLSLPENQIIRINQLEEILEHNNNEEPKQELAWLGDKKLKQKANELNSTKSLSLLSTPNNLTVKLRNYQHIGFSWLQFLTQHNLGGILADDMGLGKTLQILAHILEEKNCGKLTSPCLIVVPTTLLSNWQAEISKFTPSLSSLVLSGLNRHSRYNLIKNIDIVIISYGVMVRDIKKLLEYNFHLLILDEAQAIKNSKTKAAQVASSIHAKNRVCLSGTPIENHLGELWSLFNFLMPGYLGSKKLFENIFQFPIEKEGNSDRQKALSKRVSPFMLRRTKSEVAKELPDKTEIIQVIELPESQANLYETIRLSTNDEIKDALQKTNKTTNKLIISNALLRLRQVCCHPALLNIDVQLGINESAKLDWLTTVLPNMVEEGNKILLFSSFTSMLDIIESHLIELKIPSLKLTGKTPSNKRGQLIEKFQSGQIPVFLISLKAGGAGINLTTADTVIHFDPWWNPAAESQASDRAHRIGQNKNVFVYKLITKGTVEQKIQQMQKNKHALAQGIFDNQAQISNILGNGQWQEFFKPIDVD